MSGFFDNLFGSTASNPETVRAKRIEAAMAKRAALYAKRDVVVQKMYSNPADAAALHEYELLTVQIQQAEVDVGKAQDRD